MHDREKAKRGLEKVLGTSAVEWTISSKSNRFDPMKLTLDKDPKTPNGYRISISLHKPEEESSLSFASSSSSSASSSHISLSDIELPEMTFSDSELSEMASNWSGESAETSLSSPPPSLPDPRPPTYEEKGKAREWPEGDPRRLQPHYRSMLDV